MENTHKAFAYRVPIGAYNSVDDWSTPPQLTVAMNELLCMKNAGAQIAMDFS